MQKRRLPSDSLEPCGTTTAWKPGSTHTGCCKPPEDPRASGTWVDADGDGRLVHDANLRAIMGCLDRTRRLRAEVLAAADAGAEIDRAQKGRD